LFGFVEALLKMTETNEEDVYMEVNVEGIGKIGLPIKVSPYPEAILGEVLFGLLTVKNLKIKDFPSNLRPVVDTFMEDGWVRREIEIHRRNILK
ncbi:MAG: hypothetical protein HWN68_19005, partial [Desulfobacterales bacterium]|nr:hypothetical protein [Desulfobacterales bacterium]